MLRSYARPRVWEPSNPLKRRREVPIRGAYLAPRRNFPLVLLLVDACIIAAPFYAFAFINYEHRGLSPSLAAAALLAIAYVVPRFGRRSFVPKAVRRFAFLLVCSAFISAVIGMIEDGSSAFTSVGTVFFQIAIGVLVALAVANLKIKSRQLVHLLRVWLMTATGIALFGLYQGFAAIYGLPYAALRISNDSFSPYQRLGGYGTMPFLRRASIFPEPGWYGSYVVLALIAITLALVAGRKRIVVFRHRAVNFFVAVTLALALVQSGSLGAYVDFLIIVAVFVALDHDLRRRIRLTILLGGMLAVVLVVSVAAGRSLLEYGDTTVSQLVDSLSGWHVSNGMLQSNVNVNSLNARLNIASTAVDVWRRGPMVGWIFGRGLNFLKRHPANTGLYVEVTSSNEYCQTLADQGLLGVFAFVGLFFGVALKLHRSYRGSLGQVNGPSEAKTISLILSYVLLAVMIELCLDPVHVHDWLILGMALLAMAKPWARDIPGTRNGRQHLKPAIRMSQ